MRKANRLGRVEDGGNFAPYILANRVGVTEPDSRQSAGAAFLIRVFEDWIERLGSELEDGAETLDTVNRGNIARDVSSAVVPVWTVDTWVVWADLCLYSWWTDRLEEHGIEFELEDGNLGQLAAMVCGVVAEMLIEALFDALDLATEKP
jgi:hypothetical protein